MCCGVVRRRERGAEPLALALYGQSPVGLSVIRTCRGGMMLHPVALCQLKHSAKVCIFIDLCKFAFFMLKKVVYIQASALALTATELLSIFRNALMDSL